MTNQSSDTSEKNLVPKGITIGLGVFCLVLVLAGYGFRLLAGDELMEIILPALVVVYFFWLGIPTLLVLGARIMNKYTDSHIQTRNAWTLGWLLSCVAILTLMGYYS